MHLPFATWALSLAFVRVGAQVCFSDWLKFSTHPSAVRVAGIFFAPAGDLLLLPNQPSIFQLSQRNPRVLVCE
jgi:hypothetical protein